jgi:hypothetical protein
MASCSLACAFATASGGKSPLVTHQHLPASEPNNNYTALDAVAAGDEAMTAAVYEYAGEPTEELAPSVGADEAGSVSEAAADYEAGSSAFSPDAEASEVSVQGSDTADFAASSEAEWSPGVEAFDADVDGGADAATEWPLELGTEGRSPELSDSTAGEDALAWSTGLAPETEADATGGGWACGLDVSYA